MNNEKLSLRELLEQQFDRYGVTDESPDTEPTSTPEAEPVPAEDVVTEKTTLCVSPEWLERLCQHHSGRCCANGIFNATDWLQALADMDELLEAHPQETINFLARAYGVYPSIGCSPFETGNAPYLDRVAGFMRSRQKAKAYAAIDRLIEQAVCPDGTCKYPHYPHVRGEMFRLLNCGAASSVADAYNQAIWLTEKVRQQLIREQADALLSQRAADAEKSKPAGFCAAGKPCGAVEEKPSIRALLERAFNKAGIYE